MRLCLTLICVAFLTLSYAQKPDWIRNAETDADSYGDVDGKRIAVHPDGSIFLLGQYNGSSTLNGQPLVSKPNTIDDGFLAKYNSQGDLIWIKQIFESKEWYSNRVIDIKVDHTGDLVFAGACFWPTSILGSQEGAGPFIAKIDKDGNLKWVNFEADVSLQDSDVSRRGNRIGFDPQHNILWYTDQIFMIDFDHYRGGLAVIKYKPDGTKVSNTFLTRNSTFYHPALHDFAVDGEGNMIVSGSYPFDVAFVGGPFFRNNAPSPRVNPRQFFVAKFSPDGNFLWVIHTDRGGSSIATAHVVDHEGNIYFSAQVGDGSLMYTSSGTHSLNQQHFLAKVTPDGHLVWLNQLNNTSVHDLLLAPDGLIYVTGYAYATMRYQSYIRSRDPGSGSAFVLKINTEGYFYGVLHGDGMDDPGTPFGADAYGYQSMVDTNGNIFTMGGFWEGVSWGCTPAVTREYSFFLIKHTPVDSPVRSISGPAGAVCAGNSVTLTTDLISNAVLYKWFTPGGPDPGEGTKLKNSITLITDAEYDKQPVIVSITDNCDEYFAEPFVLNIPAPPSAPELIAGEELVCPGSTEAFTITEIGNGNAYHWTLPENITSSSLTASGGTLDFDDDFISGTVKVSVSNACGLSELQFNIGSHKTPATPELTGNVTLCPGFGQVKKTISPVAGAVSYQWELPPFVSLDPAYPQNSTSLYANVFPQFQSGEIKVRAVGHCDVSEPSSSLFVTRGGDPGHAQPLAGPPEICLVTDQVVTYSIPPVPNAQNYVWEIPAFFDRKGKIITAVPYIDLRADIAGSGELKVYGTNNCEVEGGPASISIESFDALPKPVVTMNECDNELTVTNASDFDWYVNGIRSPGLAGDQLILSDSGIYHVEVSNFCGVQQSDPVQAYPLIRSKILMPNVITPNGDGNNDFFVIDKSLKNSSIEIMNRWGRPVYSSQNYQNSWNADGLSSGSYLYLLRNHCLPAPYRGQIHVLR